MRHPILRAGAYLLTLTLALGSILIVTFLVLIYHDVRDNIGLQSCNPAAETCGSVNDNCNPGWTSSVCPNWDPGDVDQCYYDQEGHPLVHPDHSRRCE